MPPATSSLWTIRTSSAAIRTELGEKGRHVFPRADVKNVKFTRYGISALGGAAIGAGTGAIIGAATSRGTSDFINMNGLYRAACAVTGAFGGAAVGAATDMFRGPTVYRRNETK